MDRLSALVAAALRDWRHEAMGLGAGRIMTEALGLGPRPRRSFAPTRRSTAGPTRPTRPDWARSLESLAPASQATDPAPQSMTRRVCPSRLRPRTRLSRLKTR